MPKLLFRFKFKFELSSIPKVAYLYWQNGTVTSIKLAFDYLGRLFGWHGKGACVGVWLKPCWVIHTFSMRQPLSLIWLDKQDQPIKVVPKTRCFCVYFCWLAWSVVELPISVFYEAKVVD